MKKNILDEITERYNSLTRAGKKLADYLFAHTEDAQYMSITSLAEASGVAEATITRFCRSLGLEGYNDFKLALAKLDTAAAGMVPTEQVHVDDSVFSMCQKLYTADVNALWETMQLMRADSVERAVTMLLEADRVYCFGQGGSMVMAMEAWARFATASPRFHHIEDSHMQAMTAALCGERDVILFFSYSGGTRDILDVLRPAKKRGARVVLVTHFAKSPAAQYADVLLLCGSKESPLMAGAVATKMGQLFIIDYLFHEYCRRYPNSGDNRNATMEAISPKLL